jgi:hypothetical protein
MLDQLFGLLGIPKCAKDGCSFPGIIRFEFEDGNGPVWADLCPLCLPEVKKCLGEMGAVMKERKQVLETIEKQKIEAPEEEV